MITINEVKEKIQKQTLVYKDIYDFNSKFRLLQSCIKDILLDSINKNRLIRLTTNDNSKVITNTPLLTTNYDVDSIKLLHPRTSTKEKINQVSNVIKAALDDPKLGEYRSFYSQQLKNFKDILHQINNETNMIITANVTDNKIVNIDDINSLFVYQIDQFANSGNYYLLINDLFIASQNIYVCIDKKYTEIINYLGFLCDYQYKYIYQHPNAYWDIHIDPASLTVDSLRKGLHECMKHKSALLQNIKDNWPLDTWTEFDQQCFDKIQADKLLQKLV